MAFMSAAQGDGLFPTVMFVLQLAFHGMAAACYARIPGINNKLFRLITVFLRLNTLALAATAL